MFTEVNKQLKSIVNEADPEFHSKVSEAQRQAMEAAARVSDKSYDQVVKDLGVKEEIRAKYKIEILFGAGRTVNGPNLVGIQLWESGKRFHGGGDDLMYWCQDSQQNEGCWTPITSDCIKGGFAFCPGCKRTINAERLTNLRVGRVSTTRLAEDLALMFRQLGSNADLYCKYDQTDIRYVAMLKQHGSKTARRLRGMNIYPLKNILADTAAGADLVKRIRAYLSA